MLRRYKKEEKGAYYEPELVEVYSGMSLGLGHGWYTCGFASESAGDAAYLQTSERKKILKILQSETLTG